MEAKLDETAPSVTCGDEEKFETDVLVSTSESGNWKYAPVPPWLLSVLVAE